MKNKGFLYFKRILIVALITILAIGIGGYCIGYVLFKGPSKSLNEVVKYTFLETRRFGWVPYIYLSEDEVGGKWHLWTVRSVGEDMNMDESMIHLDEEEEEDPYNLPDEDGDGIIQQELKYKGSTIYLITVLDPQRVFVAPCVDRPRDYGYGKTLDVLVEENDALGGINGGGFLDDGGVGTGWPPEGIVYSNGICYYSQMSGPTAALDNDGLLHVGYFSKEDCDAMGVRDAVSLGPILLLNGEITDRNSLASGINPRTAIGQRADGAIVMMVADGRQAYSIGISYADCADIMAEQGCINAICMDGGNSSSMYYDGELINHPANPAGGTRDLPDAWLIRK